MLQFFLKYSKSRCVKQIKNKPGLFRVCVPPAPADASNFGVPCQHAGTAITSDRVDVIGLSCRCGGASLLSGRLFCNGPDRPKEDLCPRAAARRGRLHAHHRSPGRTYECVCVFARAGSQVSVCSSYSYSSGMSALNKSQQACRSRWSTKKSPAGGRWPPLITQNTHALMIFTLSIVCNTKCTWTKSKVTSKK